MFEEIELKDEIECAICVLCSLRDDCPYLIDGIDDASCRKVKRQTDRILTLCRQAVAKDLRERAMALLPSPFSEDVDELSINIAVIKMNILRKVADEYEKGEE